MARKTKILIITDSPRLPTGMAETTRLIFGGLLDQYPGQYELHQVGLFDSHPAAEARWPVYPTRTAVRPDGETVFLPEDAYSQKTFPEIVERVRPDIVFAFNDQQRVPHLCVPRGQRSWKLVLYLNFDGLPIQPTRAPVIEAADLVVTMSQFSSRVAFSCAPGLDPKRVGYLYSPADVDRFKPLGEGERAALRDDLLPDWMPYNAFVLGFVGRNQWRKQIWLPYQVIHHLRVGDYLICPGCNKITLPNWGVAFDSSAVRKRGYNLFDPLTKQFGNPSNPNYSSMHRTCNPRIHVSTNAAMRCHHCGSTNVQPAAPQPDTFLCMHTPNEPRVTWPKPLLEAQFDVQPGRDLHYTADHDCRKQPTADQMAKLYQIWDCLLYLSGGEGFGLPAWEAMCSGLPVVYTNYSSHAEFLGLADAGLPVVGTLQPEGKTAIWRMIANVPEALEAVRKLRADRALGTRLGANGRAFAQQYAREAQAAKWHEIFRRLTQEPK